MSDANGNLLFYCGNWNVYDANHTVMPGSGNLYGNSSSSQGFIALPKPGSTTIYYLFIADDLNGTFTPNPPLTYTEIDMSLNGGMGDVTANNNIVMAQSSCEKVTAIRHANGTDFWVVAHDGDTDAFYSYLVSSTGVSLTPVTSNVGNDVGGSIYNRSGCMKISPNGEKLVICHTTQNLMELLDFDNATGQVSNPVTEYLGSGWDGPYGVEFSQSGDLVYITAYPSLYQYDISAGTFASQIFLGNIGGGVVAPKALQMGPDCKIYLSKNAATLDVINDPDQVGTACNYVANALNLGGNYSQIGLPHFFPEYVCNSTPTPTVTTASFTPSNNDICAGDCITFTDNSFGTNINTWTWTFDGGNPAIGNGQDPGTVCFDNAGIYNVTLQITDDITTDDTIIVITVNPCSGVPLASFTPSDLTPCEGECITFADGSLGTNISDWSWTFTGGSPTSAIGQDPGTICYTAPGAYLVTLQITDDNGSDDTTMTVVVSQCDEPVGEADQYTTFVPDIFSPNGDGNNDLLFLRGKGIKTVEFSIYNRWGERVFTTMDHTIGWDGTFRDKPMNSDVFVYTFHVVFENDEERSESGNFTLVR